ncbi:hypothetical protein PFISCL1PPCAC_11343, partial [Pristionchus fissidentatus]
EMDESMDESIKKEDTSSVSILQSGSGGGPRRRYHRKDAKKRKLEDPNAPRRPRSAYVHFLSSQRAKYGSGKGGGTCNQREINEQLAAEWRALTDTERQVFINKSNLEKEEYATLMESYVKTPEFRNFNAQKAQMKKDKHGDFDEANTSKSHKAKKHGKAHGKERDFDCQPIDTGIFSDQFVAYNKEQETSLRSLRRQIGQTEDELESLKRTSHSLHVNSEHLRESIKKDRLEADRLEDTLSSWLDQVKGSLGEDEMDDGELEAYLEDMLANEEEHKEVMDKLAKALNHTTFVVHQ